MGSFSWSRLNFLKAQCTWRRLLTSFAFYKQVYNSNCHHLSTKKDLKMIIIESLDSVEVLIMIIVVIIQLFFQKKNIGYEISDCRKSCLPSTTQQQFVTKTWRVSHQIPTILYHQEPPEVWALACTAGFAPLGLAALCRVPTFAQRSPDPLICPLLVA